MHVPSYLKPYIPWITRWLGFRDSPTVNTNNPDRVYVPYVWAFIGAFSGLIILQAIFGQASYFIERGVPPLVASYGASAVLCFAVIESPLAQPRAVIGGHFISALIGITYTRIFGIYNLSEGETSQPRLAWVAASLSTATAIFAMQLSKTTHPPAGATALLPIVEPAINNLNWYLLPVVLLSSTVMVAFALFTNNIQRRYPAFWWSPNHNKPTDLPISQVIVKESSDNPPGEVPVENYHASPFIPSLHISPIELDQYFASMGSTFERQVRASRRESGPLVCLREREATMTIE
ncbi:HPP family-domain-containing protein [Xylaria flabelliformis]|nr:HPP family-domain-containing protein [Xylaria flabelliformis]